MVMVVKAERVRPFKNDFLVKTTFVRDPYVPDIVEVEFPYGSHYIQV